MFYKEIVLCLMFGCIGFFLSFFVTKVVNIAFIFLMAWGSFKVVEELGLKPDWGLFDKVTNQLIVLGTGLFDMLSSITSMASMAGMLFFVAGGPGGLLLNMRLRKLVER